MSEELKPCPFCGEKPFVKSFGSKITTIFCDGEACRVHPSVDNIDLDSATKGWNTRAYEEENKKLREALQSIAGNSCCAPCQEARLVAEKALRSVALDELVKESEATGLYKTEECGG